ncbi:MAG: Uma2 family endonuclease [Pirellulaceae bacterium]|nr:Uma2 family endonuclease [Pirellulaceae bacterium]
MTSRSHSAVKLGYREYVCFPSDGRRHEIIDGDHFVNPALGTYHQTLSRRIQFQLYSQIELTGRGEVYNAPTDLELSAHDIVQPDLIVVLNERRTIVTPTKIKGIPHLVVEILSESTAGLDRRLKKEMYLRTGVPEYWIVDPDEHQLEQWVLRGGTYVPLGPHADRVTSEGLDDVTVDLSQVW